MLIDRSLSWKPGTGTRKKRRSADVRTAQKARPALHSGVLLPCLHERNSSKHNEHHKSDSYTRGQNGCPS